MKRKMYVAVGVVLALALAYAFGRFSAPIRVEEREVRVVDTTAVRLVEERAAVLQTENERLRTNVKRRVIIVERPAETVTTIEEESSTDHETGASTAAAHETTDLSVTHTVEITEREKITIREKDRYYVGAVAGVHYNDLARPLYGGQVGVRLIGPVWGTVTATAESAYVGLGFMF